MSDATRRPQDPLDAIVELYRRVRDLEMQRLRGGGVLAAWPVGSIFISTVDTNPADLLGGGTWEAFGSGRVLVGQDAGQSEFDTLGKTGGAKTHTLTVSEMPSHTHAQNPHSHDLRIAGRPAGTFLNFGDSGSSAQAGHVRIQVTANVNDERPTGGVGESGGQHRLEGAAAATATNQNTGGGNPHNNLQPYIVVKMWKRIA